MPDLKVRITAQPHLLPAPLRHYVGQIGILKREFYRGGVKIYIVRFKDGYEGEFIVFDFEFVLEDE